MKRIKKTVKVKYIIDVEENVTDREIINDIEQELACCSHAPDSDLMIEIVEEE